MKSQLTELAHLIHESQTIDELVGSLRIWAKDIITPTDTREPLYIEIIRTFTYRQQWALRIAQEQGRITSPELARRFNISMESARLDLHDLVEQGALVAISNKKGRFYIPVVPNGDPSGIMDTTGIPEGVPQAHPMALQDTLSQPYMNPEA